MQDAFVFPCADDSLKQEGHAQRQTLRHPTVESFDAVRTFDVDPEQSARGISLQEEGVVANFSEAHREASEAREDLGSTSVENLSSHVILREKLYVPPFSIPLTYIDFVRTNNNRLGQFGREHYR